MATQRGAWGAAWLGGMLAGALLGGCATPPDGASRQQAATALAHARHWSGISIPAGPFVLRAYVPDVRLPARHLTVYIEGDGLAWLSPSRVSPDPTPIRPLALQLALAQPEGNAVYLARPCQYADAAASGCPAAYWTEARFAPAVIDAENQVVDHLKKLFAASELELVGYSGGGAVAALLAARREDVVRLVTVAGNLDHAAWTAHHRLTPLTESLNPAGQAARLSDVPQWHWVGGQDRVVPPLVATAYAQRFAPGQRPVVVHLPEFDHACCWVAAWPRLWRQVNGTP